MFAGKVVAVSVCLRTSFLSSHALETPPCLSMHCCCQARGQDEDEMAPPQKMPQSCLSLCWSGLRGHTPWSGVHETSRLSWSWLRFLFLTLFYLLVAGPATELLCSMGRTKDRSATVRYSRSLHSCDSKIRYCWIGWPPSSV